MTMGKMAKLTPIELDKPRNLLLDMEAIIAFEDETGQDFLEFSRRMNRRKLAYARKRAIEAGVKDVPAPDEEDLKLPDITTRENRATLWCMLIHEDPALTLKQVGHMVTIENIQVVFDAVNAAQSVNSPEPEKKDESVVKEEGVVSLESEVPLEPALKV